MEIPCSRCSCHWPQLNASHSWSSTKLRSVDLHRKSSLFTALFHKCPSLAWGMPSRLRSSLPNDPEPKSEDGTENSPEMKSGVGFLKSHPGPHEPGNNQQTISERKVSSAQSALERAAAYKKTKKSDSSTTPETGKSSSSPPWPKDLPLVEIVRSQNSQSRCQPLDSPTSSASDFLTALESSPSAQTDSSDAVEFSVDVKRSMKDKLTARASNSDDNAESHQQQQADMTAALGGDRGEPSDTSSLTQCGGFTEEKALEIEIITRDGVVKRKLLNPDEQVRAFANVKEVKRKGVSGIDFAGLGFADKKRPGRPPGLSEGFMGPPTGTIPEVEIITRDGGRSPTVDDEQELYKPRISTWGVFPRPADISKTYGGGRTIRPGEVLETEEDRKLREARTQKLLDDYRQKFGLDVDPKIKAEASQVLKEGSGLMDSGRLREALAMYEVAMEKMPVGSELHGMAALQAAICLDSLSRHDEAREVYEKLLVHPNGRIGHGDAEGGRRIRMGYVRVSQILRFLRRWLQYIIQGSGRGECKRGLVTLRITAHVPGFSGVCLGCIQSLIRPSSSPRPMGLVVIILGCPLPVDIGQRCIMEPRSWDSKIVKFTHSKRA